MAIHNEKDRIPYFKFMSEEYDLGQMAKQAFLSDYWKEIEMLAPSNIERLSKYEEQYLEELKHKYRKTLAIRTTILASSVIHLLAILATLYGTATTGDLPYAISLLGLIAIAILAIPLVSKTGKHISSLYYKKWEQERILDFLQNAKNSMNIIS